MESFNWKNHVMKNMAPNFTGSAVQYGELYDSLVEGLVEEVKRSFSVQFEDIVRTAMCLSAEEEKPVVESIIKVKFNFEDLDIAQMSGKMSTDEKRKHNTPIGFTKELSDPRQARLPLDTVPDDNGEEPQKQEESMEEKPKKKVSNKGQPQGKKIKPAPSTKKKSKGEEEQS